MYTSSPGERVASRPQPGSTSDKTQGEGDLRLKQVVAAAVIYVEASGESWPVDLWSRG